MPHSAVTLRTATLTFFTLIAFASNSVLCRLALASGRIGAGTFTSVRLVSGAVALLLISGMRRRTATTQSGWSSSLALIAYAVLFSFAYLRIPAGVGALVLFGAVQTTMIGFDLWKGKRFRGTELVGLVLAVAGLIVLTLPGASAPDPVGVGLMAVAGVAWGIYSLRGRGSIDPLNETFTNFSRSLILAIPLGIVSLRYESFTPSGVSYAVASGAITSGLGYALWYTALRGLTATQAGIVQLLVPALAAIGGVLILGESVSTRLLFAGITTLAGVSLAVRK